ncbi:hypothetical protein [Amycolatopsis sp. cmx-11-12]|uniref:hypothetical protein n=1 Tax=Amycolatopsis sp. cmx-11-12 TaxID=2785795 RepID=UPI003917D817
MLERPILVHQLVMMAGHNPRDATAGAITRRERTTQLTSKPTRPPFQERSSAVEGLSAEDRNSVLAGLGGT